VRGSSQRVTAGDRHYHPWSARRSLRRSSSGAERTAPCPWSSQRAEHRRSSPPAPRGSRPRWPAPAARAPARERTRTAPDWPRPSQLRGSAPAPAPHGRQPSRAHSRGRKRGTASWTYAY